MLFKRFQKAARKSTHRGEPACMITRGFEIDTLTDCCYRHAVATRRGPGQYDVTVMENNAALAGDNRSMSGLTLQQALDMLDAWERQQGRNGRPYALEQDNTPHFRDIAADLGVTLGPEGASLRHAAGVKRMSRLLKKNKPHK